MGLQLSLFLAGEGTLFLQVIEDPLYLKTSSPLELGLIVSHKHAFVHAPKQWKRRR